MRMQTDTFFDDFRVRYFGKGSTAAFATIDMGNASIYLGSPAECDELMKAAALAKSMLTPGTDAP